MSSNARLVEHVIKIVSKLQKSQWIRIKELWKSFSLITSVTRWVFSRISSKWRWVVNLYRRSKWANVIFADFIAYFIPILRKKIQILKFIGNTITNEKITNYRFLLPPENGILLNGGRLATFSGKNRSGLPLATSLN